MQVIEGFSTPTSRDGIWQVLADGTRWKEWTPTILDVRPLGGEDLEVGALYRGSQPQLRPAILYAFRVD